MGGAVKGELEGARLPEGVKNEATVPVPDHAQGLVSEREANPTPLKPLLFWGSLNHSQSLALTDKTMVGIFLPFLLFPF